MKSRRRRIPAAVRFLSRETHPTGGPLTGLLSSLSESDRTRLEQGLESVPLMQGTVLQEQDWPVLYSYFPLSGSVSLSLSTSEGQSVVAGMVGAEGMVGPPFTRNRPSPVRA